MSVTYADRVIETSTTTGTGTFNLDGAEQGFQTFVAGVSSGAEVYYVASDGTDWEVGRGTVTGGTPDTLSRDTVLDSSNAGSAVNFSAGTKTVSLTVPEQQLTSLQKYRKNVIINGNFDIWQRGTSFTDTSAYWADRWTGNPGGGATISQQSFTLGQTAVPNEPEYFLRHDRTSAATSKNTPVYQRIEGVRTLAGKQATLRFYAKVDSGKEFNVRANQVFGSGGSPSDNIATKLGTLTGTGAWAEYTYTATIPSISGKTIGTDNNDFLQIDIHEGSSFSTFTLDIAQVQLEEGPVATQFEQRPIGEEAALCWRYFSKGDINSGGSSVFKYMSSSRTASFNSSHTFPVKMRAEPTVALLGTPLYDNCSNLSLTSVSTGGFVTRVDATGGAYRVRGVNWEADAEL